MAKYKMRKGIDPGIEKIRTWIEQWYGDLDDLDIEKIVFDVSSLDLKDVNDDRYIAA